MQINQYKNGDYKNYFRCNELEVFGFFEDFRFLSNFHKCDVFYDGHIWPSSEHAYMVAKCKIKYESFWGDYVYGDKQGISIKNMTPSEVKKWGQTVTLKEDWEQIKYAIMLQINLDKYIRNSDLRYQLLATGEKQLIEANSWGDNYWGYDINAKKGENNLGKILMLIRNILK